ncbi:MAG: proline dehydrogenase family protein [Bacteroidetes bacterium]|nr:proline dehydrogenase family protein [Bacteroidota bacterium]MBM3423901.1 proline dehydrogenase [Bacteroidota bacterium]
MLNFTDTEIAFQSKNLKDLRRAYWLFKVVSYPWIVKTAKQLTPVFLKLRLPIKGLIKATIFKQFCGGETIEECKNRIEELGKFGVGTILDYSVEGKITDEDFEYTTRIILSTIEKAKESETIPFAVFKITALGRFDVLEMASNPAIRPTETAMDEIQIVKNRFERICEAAAFHQVRLFLDAEETWIQPVLDAWTWEMMCKYNQQRAIIYNTVQMYCHDRLSFLKEQLEKSRKAGIVYGVKLVRGAYMEKERERARALGYPSPIQADKPSTDFDYNQALRFMVEHHAHFAFCAGTHNEESSLLLAELMQEKQLDKSNEKFFFAQLLGMSDHISYNLANAGYNVAKYVPFGPVREVLPYLLRRADENTSVAGQTGRELGLISEELKRRARCSGKLT